ADRRCLMPTATAFLAALKHAGLTFFSGVPCSLLEDILHHCLVDPDVTYVPAPREDAALGIASASYFNGECGAIFLQNSGLGNLVNPLTSFNLIYHIPVFMVISWRGYQGNDAPEHLVMGAKTIELLELMDIPYVVLG